MNARLLYLSMTAALLALSGCAQTPPAATTTGTGSRGAADAPREPLPALPMSRDNPAGPTENPAAPMAVPSAPRDDLYMRADTNKDGRVSADEWEAARRGSSTGSSLPR